MRQKLMDGTFETIEDIRSKLLTCEWGLGEGFEQRPIETEDGDLYVHSWVSAVVKRQNCTVSRK